MINNGEIEITEVLFNYDKYFTPKFSKEFYQKYEEIYGKKRYINIAESYVEIYGGYWTIDEKRYDPKILDIYKMLGAKKSSSDNSNIQMMYIPTKLIGYIICGNKHYISDDVVDDIRLEFQSIYMDFTKRLISNRMVSDDDVRDFDDLQKMERIYYEKNMRFIN